MKTRSLVLIGVLVIALAAMAMPVMAATTASATITGNPTATTEITLSANSLPLTLTPGSTASDNSITMTSTSNNANGFTVSVKDAMDNGKESSHAGHMMAFNAGSYTEATYLAANMTAATSSGADATDAGTITLKGPNAQTIQSTTAPKQVLNKAITFSQAVAYTDARLTTGSYQIVVQFDIAAN